MGEGLQIAVMGAGAWGTAFSMVLSDAGNTVTMWARRPEVADGITHEHRNPDYLDGVDLPVSLTATVDAQAALRDADAVVLAVPSQQLRANLAQWELPEDALLVSLAKGVESQTLQTMSQVVAESGVDRNRIIVVTGPNLADEIAHRQPAASVVSAYQAEVAEHFQRACGTPYFRPYTNTDVIGCEIGGATKNAIALAVGMGIGLGFGANSMAALMTRGLAETTRLGEAMDADPHTFAGMAGMGDLVATCMSPLSRNRSFGEYLGRGFNLEEATAASRGVAEGVRSSASILALADSLGVEMPIVGLVVQVLKDEIGPEEAIRTLMARVPKPER